MSEFHSPEYQDIPTNVAGVKLVNGCRHNAFGSTSCPCWSGTAYLFGSITGKKKKLAQRKVTRIAKLFILERGEEEEEEKKRNSRPMLAIWIRSEIDLQLSTSDSGSRWRNGAVLFPLKSARILLYYPSPTHPGRGGGCNL